MLVYFHLLAKLFQIDLDNIYPRMSKALPLYHHNYKEYFEFDSHLWHHNYHILEILLEKNGLLNPAPHYV